MNFDLKKVPSLTLGLLMTSEFIFAQVIDGAWGVFFVWFTLFFWELWYMRVLVVAGEKAPDYYNGVVGRFKASVAMLLSVETIFSLMSVGFILMPDVLPTAAVGVAKSVRFLIHSLLFVWQITMLLNAFAATMSADEYKAERGKIVLMLVFAPLGALTMHNE